MHKPVSCLRYSEACWKQQIDKIFTNCTGLPLMSMCRVEKDKMADMVALCKQ